MKTLLADRTLVDLLRKAYSAEKAAAFAYQGHAGSVKNKDEKKSIKQIEMDEWNHRREVGMIMSQYHIPVSKWYEVKSYFIGRTLCISCYLIGWFMPFYFAGSLESGNVCEYIRMKRLFNKLNITEHDKILYEMSVKEKEHEIFFYEKIKNNKRLPFFERIFSWGKKSKNDVDLENGFKIDTTNSHCKGFGEKIRNERKAS
ncbi:MAG TPA: ferritin-like domain-containing protein [Chitinophagaceae bacterium]|nr:ferritin-like domain-containing protein [Chitinophagaceae bacterium]